MDRQRTYRQCANHRGNNVTPWGGLQQQLHVGDVTQSPFDVFLQTSLQHTREVRRLRRQCAPVRFAAQHARQRVRYILAGERALLGEHLVQDAAERPDVAPRCD